MLRIKLTTSFPEFPLLRQTPGRSGQWEDCQFFTDQDAGDCDAWVVYEGLSRAETARCSPAATLLVTGEPPEVHTYHPSFVDQFAAVITCQPEIRAPRVFRQQQSLPWHIGVLRNSGNAVRFDYDDFRAMEAIEKTKLVSLICSDKAFTNGHRQRLAFAERLKRRFGERLDVFGHGRAPTDDKWEAIAPYRYHITLENTQREDYWTEKLADAYLAAAYPLYFGCCNLERYFPAGCCTPIDIARPSEAIRTIEDVLAADPYERLLPQIRLARQLVLDRYNVFPMLAHACRRLAESSRRRATVVLRPEAEFHAGQRRGLRQRIGRLFRPRRALTGTAAPREDA